MLFTPLRWKTDKPASVQDTETYRQSIISSTLVTYYDYPQYHNY